ncbi:MAG: hypothetical protein GX491_07115 [Chloroflexi bacterium]|nr:hypothetical protein [Chloroflexota bacterium]
MYPKSFYHAANKKRPVYRSDGRIIGQLQGDTLVKKVTGSRHMLRTPKAWTVDVVAAEQAKRAGARYIEIRDRESGITYRVSLDRFIRYGIRLDRGYGAQIALPLEKWTVMNPGDLTGWQLDLF